jgi:hypothetical protein
MSEPVRIFINDRYWAELFGLECKKFEISQEHIKIFFQSATSEKVSLEATSTDDVFLIDIGRKDPPNFLLRLETKSTVTKNPKQIPGKCIND